MVFSSNLVDVSWDSGCGLINGIHQDPLMFCQGMNPKTRGPAEFKEWKSMQSTAFAERLRAEDIMVQIGSGAMAANGCFQRNIENQRG